MKLSITKETTVASLQSQFHAYFPHLKIEVFLKKHEVHELTKGEQSLPANSLLSVIPTFVGGVYEFKPLVSTSEFEQGLATFFGIPVQVLRQSGGTWLQTAQTDDWSLEKQNKQGKMSATSNTPDEIVDYNLSDIE